MVSWFDLRDTSPFFRSERQLFFSFAFSEIRKAYSFRFSERATTSQPSESISANDRVGRRSIEHMGYITPGSILVAPISARRRRHEIADLFSIFSWVQFRNVTLPEVFGHRKTSDSSSFTKTKAIIGLWKKMAGKCFVQFGYTPVCIKPFENAFICMDSAPEKHNFASCFCVFQWVLGLFSAQNMKQGHKFFCLCMFRYFSNFLAFTGSQFRSWFSCLERGVNTKTMLL